MDRCGECGLEYEDHGPLRLAARLASLGPRYGERLRLPSRADGDAFLRERPKPQVWSVLEYACHVRDVLLAQRERLFLALVEDRPSFAPIYREQRVLLACYGAQDPGRVADQLDLAATLVAGAFSHVDEAGWLRNCTYNVPRGGTHRRMAGGPFAARGRAPPH